MSDKIDTHTHTHTHSSVAHNDEGVFSPLSLQLDQFGEGVSL